MSDSIREMLHFQDLTPEEKEKRGILCRLYGPCADFAGPTRNGRKYGDDLWENVFTKNPLVLELLKNGGIPGEAQHPVDRDEIDVEKIAIMMPEAPKKDENGHLIAYFDVQDTPCGRILYQLARYGFKIGISSRGNGDVIEDENGEEIVDPETYDFTCFDAVITPSVEAARMNMVESLDTSKDLKKALKESISKSNKDEQKIMKETLKSLGIKLTETKKPSINTQKSEDINKEVQLNEGITDNVEVEDTKSNELVKTLKETITSKVKLEKQLQELQEQLAASDTRAKKLEEELQKHKTAVIRLSNQAREGKDLKKEVSTLKEQLNEKTEEVETQSRKIKLLTEKLSSTTTSSKTLNESISSKDKQLASLQEKINSSKKLYDENINKLKENLNSVKNELSDKEKEFSTKLDKAKKLIEKYKNYLVTSVNRYIESKATMLGITPNEIKNRLSESYTIDEIDQVCEDLQSYNLRISKLPFSVERNTRIKMTESKQSKYEPLSPEDDISGLVEIAGLE